MKKTLLKRKFIVIINKAAFGSPFFNTFCGLCYYKVMLSKDLHPVRRRFRKALLGLAGISLLFLIFVIGLRVHYRDGNIDGPMQTALFEFDVLQYKVRAFIGDDEKDMLIISELFKLGFFSKIYTDAGMDMLEHKAQDGYAPAIAQLALLQSPTSE